jgi:hypothetical protein
LDRCPIKRPIQGCSGNNWPSKRAKICALKALDPTIVGVALEKAERELASLRLQYDTETATAAVNSARVIRLLEWITAWELESPDTPEHWERLTDLVRLVPVSLTTKQHPTRTFGGKPVGVQDRAFLRRGTEMDESIPVEDLPPFCITGGAFDFAELALAVRIANIE